MSQEQLAARAQVAAATVRKIEKGVVIEPGYFTVLALMQALGVRREDPAELRPAAPSAIRHPDMTQHTIERYFASWHLTHLYGRPVFGSVRGPGSVA